MLKPGNAHGMLESNPRLTKLCVPGCTRLGINGVASFQVYWYTGYKAPKNGGLYAVTHSERPPLCKG